MLGGILPRAKRDTSHVFREDMAKDAGTQMVLADFLAAFGRTHRTAAGLQGQLSAMGRFNSTKRLGSLGDCPTLVVTGSDDVVVPPANAASIAEKVPGAELLTWPDAGHFWWQHRTVEVCERIARFLLEFFVADQYTRGDAPDAPPLMRPLTNSNLVLDFHR